MDERAPYWFAAKQNGRGWGWPLRWQGWVVYATSLFVAAFTLYSDNRQHPVRTLLILMSIALVVGVLGFFKGDPAGRRNLS